MTESGDYISREETLQRLCEDVCNVSDCQCDEIRCPEWHLIYDIPAADVRPVVRGKWKVSVHKTYYDVSCSVCGINSFFQVDEKDSVSYANFCPNCGANMREES